MTNGLKVFLSALLLFTSAQKAEGELVKDSFYTFGIASGGNGQDDRWYEEEFGTETATHEYNGNIGFSAVTSTLDAETFSLSSFSSAYSSDDTIPYSYTKNEFYFHVDTPTTFQIDFESINMPSQLTEVYIRDTSTQDYLFNAYLLGEDKVASLTVDLIPDRVYRFYGQTVAFDFTESDGGFAQFNFSMSAVPEPSSLALVGMAIGVVSLRRRRR